MSVIASSSLRTVIGVVAVVALGLCLGTAIAEVELSTLWFSVRFFGMFAAMLTIAYVWPRPIAQTYAPRLYKWSRLYFGATTAIFVAWLLWVAAQAPGWSGLLAMAVFGAIGIFGWSLVAFTVVVVPLWAIVEGVLRVGQVAKGSDV